MSADEVGDRIAAEAARADAERKAAAVPGVLPLDDLLRRRLIALTGCAATDLSRPVLCHVAFEAFTAWATDSYVLGRLHLPDGNGPAEQRVVPARELAAVLRRAKKRDTVVLEFGDDAATVTVESPSLFSTTSSTVVRLPYPTKADGEVRFPDVAQLIPAIEPAGGVAAGPAPAFNPRHLARVAALAGPSSSTSAAPVVRLRWPAAEVVEGVPMPLKAMQVEDGAGDLLGLVMPVRL